MRIAIIGGGIGGLTAALALRQYGFNPEVFEQAPPAQGGSASLSPKEKHYESPGNPAVGRPASLR
ncbi:MAG: FAD-dependent oxidoreductase [Pyrinomonadaceae bacterium]